MYSEISQSDGDEVVRARLARLTADLRSLTLPTREEVQAEVYDRLNRVLSLGNRVSPLLPLTCEGPAVVGDVTGNLQLVNQDAQDILRQLLVLEDEAARLFNLTAATQNSLRQQVREMAFLTTKKRYLEPFISDANFLTVPSQGSFEFGVGMASLPFVDETETAPVRIEVGLASDGTLSAPLANLTDGLAETAMVWDGTQVELIFTFEPPAILNRLHVELDNYQGLNLDALTSTPDGIFQEDLKAEIADGDSSLDGSSNKFSGDFTVDFDARHVSKLRMVLSDRAGSERIALRNVRCFGRRYASYGVIQTRAIEFPELGLVSFLTEEHTSDTLTALSHQISYDGVQFSHISPGQQIDLGGTTCWYRAVLERLDANFKEDHSAPIEDPGLKPDFNSLCRINGVTTTELGGGVVERVITIDLLSKAQPDGVPRPLCLWEVPLPSTLTIYQGTALLGPDQYQLHADTLSFSGNDERDGLVIRYQLPLNTRVGLSARREYFTPRLYQVSFERI